MDSGGKFVFFLFFITRVGHYLACAYTIVSCVGAGGSISLDVMVNCSSSRRLSI